MTDRNNKWNNTYLRPWTVIPSEDGNAKVEKLKKIPIFFENDVEKRVCDTFHKRKPMLLRHMMITG